MLNDPRVPPDIDAVVMESTYGDRYHRPLADSVAEFYDAIRDADDRGGAVFGAAFVGNTAGDEDDFVVDGFFYQFSCVQVFGQGDPDEDAAFGFSLACDFAQMRI